MTAYLHREDFDPDFVLHLEAPALPTGRARHLLLTGASGFLGRFVLVDLLEHTDWRVTCLVRAPTAEAARAKLLRSMKRAGWARETLPERVEAVCGDIEQPCLGLAGRDDERLAAEVDSVVHAAAQVAWSKAYAQLRDTNVFGAREVARWCARRRLKRLVFVSSIATRYSPVVEGTIDEGTDMRPVVHRIGLGYGQSKCVAESLVETLHGLGAPVSVIRPSLIGAHRRTGVLNSDDFIARMFVTIAGERIAPAMNVHLDAVAVDEAAAVVRACVSEDPAPGTVRRLHLQSPEAPFFGEVVAAMNLFCPGARLMDWEPWLAYINGRAKESRHPLHPLRAFLLGRAPWDKSLRTPELLDARWQARIDSSASRAWLAERGLALSAQDGASLERALAWLAARGRLTMTRRFQVAPRPQGHDTSLPAQLVQWAKRYAPGRPVDTVVALRASADPGLVSRVLGWRYGDAQRNCIAHLGVSGRSAAAALDVFVKHTPAQETVHMLGAALGDLADGELGARLGHEMALLDFAHLDTRELHAYREGPALRSGRAPRLVGAARLDGSVRLALECLAPETLVAQARWTEPWPVRSAPLVARTLAAWQCLPVGPAEATVYAGPGTAQLRGAQPLWERLAAQSERLLAQHAPEAVHHLRGLLARMHEHWARHAVLARTFVHNDFNPRNLARTLDGAGNVRAIRVFDWQLCTLAPAARDLAEFLCFAADRGRIEQDLPVWLASHREALEEGGAGACDCDPQGFAWALDDWALRRLPLYALYDRTNPQAFVADLVRNWWALRQATAALPVPRRAAGSVA